MRVSEKGGYPQKMQFELPWHMMTNRWILGHPVFRQNHIQYISIITHINHSHPYVFCAQMHSSDKHWLVVWFQPTPPKNIQVKWDYKNSQYMESHVQAMFQSPPTFEKTSQRHLTWSTLYMEVFAKLFTINEWSTWARQPQGQPVLSDPIGGGSSWNHHEATNIWINVCWYDWYDHCKWEFWKKRGYDTMPPFCQNMPKFGTGSNSLVSAANKLPSISQA